MYAPPNYTVLCLRCLSLRGSSCKVGGGRGGFLKKSGRKIGFTGKALRNGGSGGRWSGFIIMLPRIGLVLPPVGGMRERILLGDSFFLPLSSFSLLFFSSHSSSSPFFLFKLEKATCYPTMLLGFLVSWKQIAALHISAILRREQASASKFPM